jgi:pyruvate ferredoxin oxidoreductase gamma subunit
MSDQAKTVEIRWHGRGGQGAVTSAELVAQAAILEDKYAQAFPSFSPERRGAPVMAFNRVNSEKPIRTRAEVDQPDVVIVLDSGLLSIVNPASGLKETGIIIVNTKKTSDEIRKELGIKQRVATVDATKIALETLGIPIVNTTMVGALVKTTDVIKLESMEAPLQKRFARLAERNIQAMKKAFEETSIEEH